jgi:TRAP-type transport system periplasmic protein
MKSWRNIFCLLVISFFTQAGLAEAAIEWNMATPYADSLFQEVNVIQFTKDIKEGTKGGLIINVHNSSSLFRHPEIKKAVQTGQIEMGEVQLSSYANEEELYNYDNVPFMATTYEEETALWEATRPFLAARLMKDRLRLLYGVAWPPQGIYTTKLLKAVSDFKGLKCRTANRMTARLAELLGTIPIVVTAPEVPQAFSTGMVNAMITSSAFGVSNQAWDFVKNFLDIGAWLGMNQVFINERAFQSLKPEFQKVILDAAAKAEVRGRNMSIEANEVSKRLLTKNGMNVYLPSPEFLRDVKSLAAPMNQEWIKAVGGDGKKIWDKYQELRPKK